MVVTDRLMSDMSGDDVAAGIRQQDARVAILMLTGYGDMMQDAGVCPPGVTKVISKPVSYEVLDLAIAELRRCTKARSASA